jgi:hypothetical protein
MILVHTSPKTLAPYRTENLGVLCSPRRVYGEEMDGWPWAADNDAYSSWDEERYENMLVKITGRENCLFVTCPDVVGDSEKTLELFYEWWPVLRRRNLPVALVAQDGLRIDEVPWWVIDCLFIGGTTEFKMGEEAANLVRFAKLRRKWVHMGRVNSYERTRYARWLGCDSIDGTQFSWFRDAKLPAALNALKQEALCGL